MSVDWSDRFVSSPDRQAKLQILRGYARRFGCRTLLETGLYNGTGAGADLLADGTVERWVVIDSQRSNIDQLPADPRVFACLGDSATVLPILLSEPGYLHQLKPLPILFWLDAHEWAGREFGDTPRPSPLLAELRAILAWQHGRQSVVLVDDVRQLADQPLAQPGWPSLAELEALVGERWQLELADDIVRLTPC